MHDIAELPQWDRMLKRIVWTQLGEIEGKRILDFGSGEGITANHFADKNRRISKNSSFSSSAFYKRVRISGLSECHLI